MEETQDISENTIDKKELKSKNKHKSLNQEGKEIIRAIEKIKSELELTRMNFNIVTDEVLIDSYIYEIISLNKKYQYFLRLAKKSGLVADGFEKIV